MRHLFLSDSTALFSRLRLLAFAMIALVIANASSLAATVTFGSGANAFSMEFVTIGNPGNAPDADPDSRPISSTLGSVGYTYEIGKFEVTEDMIAKFNASGSLQITASSRGPNKPATFVSWNEAARFVNWLNTITGHPVAYNFTSVGINDDIALWAPGDAGYNAANPYRNSLARYVLPNHNEWYKSAYFNPTNNTYYDHANGKDTAPGSVASGTADNTAVYGQTIAQGPADVTNAGGLSPYGVMALGGNVLEWEETAFDLTNSSATLNRAVRGGRWYTALTSPHLLGSRARAFFSPSQSDQSVGFRVVSITPSTPPAVPEPSSVVIATLLGLGGLVTKRRRNK